MGDVSKRLQEYLLLEIVVLSLDGDGLETQADLIRDVMDEIYVMLSTDEISYLNTRGDVK